MNSRQIFLILLFGVGGAAHAQLRVATWNVTNYTSGRTDAFQTAIYGSFQGRQMAPDVIMGQEFRSSSAITNFVNMLNSAAGSPNDWAAAPWVNHGDTSSAFFYRTSKIDFVGQSVVNGDPRLIGRYDIKFKGYEDSASSPIMALYSTHMKSGSSSDDQSRRLYEATAVRNDANSLPSNYSFMLGGDLNIQTSTQAAYQKMVGSDSNNRGQFYDPIKSPGNWNNNANYRFLHTQDPSGAGGMDDRFDQLLVSGDLTDGKGLDYIGDAHQAYSDSTWDDPNHSYRVWGNDGSSFNGQITTTGNTMVGGDIAQALIESTGNTNPNVTGGHLPVFLDLRMQGEIGASTSFLDFGNIRLGSDASRFLDIFNSVDAGIWGVNGVAALNYTMEFSSGFFGSGDPFSDAAGGGVNNHQILADTSHLGLLSGFLTIRDVSGLTRTIGLSANIVPVPEPASLAALGLGALALLRKKKTTA